MERDTWVGLAWAGGLILAMVAVFVYGAMTYEPEQFDVTWTTTDRTIQQNGDTLSEGGSDNHTFLVPGTNVTAVRIELVWSDDEGGGADEFGLRCGGPLGAKTPPQSTASPLVCRYDDLGDPTTISRARGANEDHARSEMATPPDPWTGDAAWSADVRLITAPGTPGTAGIGAQPDGANDYTIRLVYTSYEAILTPRP